MKKQSIYFKTFMDEYWTKNKKKYIKNRMYNNYNKSINNSIEKYNNTAYKCSNNLLENSNKNSIKINRKNKLINVSNTSQNNSVLDINININNKKVKTFYFDKDKNDKKRNLNKSVGDFEENNIINNNLNISLTNFASSLKANNSVIVNYNSILNKVNNNKINNKNEKYKILINKNSVDKIYKNFNKLIENNDNKYDFIIETLSNLFKFSNNNNEKLFYSNLKNSIIEIFKEKLNEISNLKGNLYESNKNIQNLNEEIFHLKTFNLNKNIINSFDQNVITIDESKIKNDDLNLSKLSENFEDLESIRFFDKIIMRRHSFSNSKIPKLNFNFNNNNSINNNDNNLKKKKIFKQPQNLKRKKIEKLSNSLPKNINNFNLNINNIQKKNYKNLKNKK